MGKGTLHGAFEGTAGSRQSATIHQGRQDKHIEGSKNFMQEIKDGRHPSKLTVDAATLLREGAGKGYMPSEKKEVVDYGRVIGKFYDKKTEKYYDTTRATIHYDSKGNAHIVPSEPKERMGRKGNKR